MPVTLDMSTAKPIGGVTLDMSTAQPIGGNTPAPKPVLQASAPPSLIQRIGSGAYDLGAGVLKSIPGTLSSIDNQVAKIPRIGNFLTTPLAGGATSEQARTDLANAATPTDTAQKVGKVVGNAAQFLIPGGAEEGAAKLLAPTVGRALPAVKAALAGIGAGAVNKAQGGTFTAGAAGGAVGSGIAQGIASVAPAIAESAMGTRRVERGFGKTPGQAILQDTKGIRPETINASAKAKIASLGSANDALAASYPGTVSIQPGIDTVDQAIAKGIGQNSKGVSIPQAEGVRLNMTQSPPISKVTGQFTTASDPAALSPLPLSPNQPALGAQNIKRGLRTDYVSNFDPTMMKGTRALANNAAGAIDGSLDSALGPEYASNNSRMSGLFSVTDAMKRRALDPSLGQKLAAKGLAHTGAGIGGLFGAGAGYREGGVPGAVLGGVAGFAGPEMLLSPEAQMLAARTMYSGLPKIAAPTLNGAVLQALRPKLNSGDTQ